jgi:hypothetical protein
MRLLRKIQKFSDWKIYFTKTQAKKGQQNKMLSSEKFQISNIANFTTAENSIFSHNF